MTRRAGTTGPVLGRYHVDGDVLYEVVLDCLAAHRLTRLITRDEFPPTAAFRNAVLARYPIQGTQFDDRYWEPWGEPMGNGHVRMRRRTDGKILVGAPYLDPATGRTVLYNVDPGEKWGVLVTCPWCSSFWLTVGVLAVRRAAPRWWSPVGRALAYSSVVGWLSGHLG